LKKQITNISPVQTAKVFAVLYFIMSIPFVGLMAISFAFAPAPRPPMAALTGISFYLSNFWVYFHSSWRVGL